MCIQYYDWPDVPQGVQIEGKDKNCWSGEELRGEASNGRGIAAFSMLRKLLSLVEVQQILNDAPRHLQRSIDEGSAMTADSVDRFPNIWHYFIQHGCYSGDLDDILKPIVEQRIEPYARKRFGPHVRVCHCFVRRYLPEERRYLSAHFDHHSYITAVVGLNPEEFEGGLFIQGEVRTERAFIYLDKGDVVFHQYNLHHGVEVTKGSRYSLVFWLMDCWESCIHGTVPWYKNSAELGDADAQHLWAGCLASGQHSGRSKPDLVAAIPWFERSVAQGNVEGMNAYAAILWEESLVRDEKRALCLWNEASELGYAKARGNLGGILCTGGDGRVRKDVAKGMRLLQSASEMGDQDAMMKLASHLRRSGNPECLKWLQRCADMGNPDACMSLIEIHMSEELGVCRDPSTIIRYTRWASNMGSHKAMSALAMFYARGEFGLELDLHKSVELWQKILINKEEAEPLANLALCFLYGLGGVDKDIPKAKDLFNRSASQGHALALRMQSYVSHLDSENMETSNRSSASEVVVAELREASYSPCTFELPTYIDVESDDTKVASQECDTFWELVD